MLERAAVSCPGVFPARTREPGSRIRCVGAGRFAATGRPAAHLYSDWSLVNQRRRRVEVGLWGGPRASKHFSCDCFYKSLLFISVFSGNPAPPLDLAKCQHPYRKADVLLPNAFLIVTDWFLLVKLCSGTAGEWALRSGALSPAVRCAGRVCKMAVSSETVPALALCLRGTGMSSLEV